jgi:hypothetical protein
MWLSRFPVGRNPYRTAGGEELFSPTLPVWLVGGRERGPSSRFLEIEGFDVQAVRSGDYGSKQAAQSQRNVLAHVQFKMRLPSCNAHCILLSRLSPPKDQWGSKGHLRSRNGIYSLVPSGLRSTIDGDLDTFPNRSLKTSTSTFGIAASLGKQPRRIRNVKQEMIKFIKFFLRNFKSVCINVQATA